MKQNILFILLFLMCGHSLNSEEIFVEMDSSSTHSPVENTKSKNTWKSLYDKTFEVFSVLNKFAEKHCSYPNYVQKDFDKSLKTFLGDDMYFLHRGDPSHSIIAGVYGKGEVYDKVRITFNNGILNSLSDCEGNCKLFSDTHGGVNVHYAFNTTEGFAEDIMECVFIKFGYITPQARLLAEIWKDLIKEMGGVNGGGLIIHYAHSIGASDTWSARNLLTPEEEAMIAVYTFGSSSLLRVNGFKEVTNYVSVRDGVCLLDPPGFISGILKHHSDSLLIDEIFWGPLEEYFRERGFEDIKTYTKGYKWDTFEWLRYLIEEDNTVVFLGDICGMPIIDHTLSAKSYREIIEARGKEFIDTYGKIEE